MGFHGVTAGRHSWRTHTVGHKMSAARVLLADDNRAFLHHVEDLLQGSYQVVGMVVDGSSVCAEASRLRPDLMVLDISMGQHSGIEIARQLRREGYAGQIVFLSIHEDPDFIGAAIGAGGRGYVFKSRMNADLGLALKSVLSSQIFISPHGDHRQ
jgi:DNA-binding NarL/FixJ family response regulator